ncbi:MAG: pyridoxal phosphate-dependent aminotransferase [Proteobacteria bacterium]|nr:pyridoxal phosphate-dependent aminotransferase [Pseudomonadota bacterium]MCP4921577.1 pyridoxal phosphate-dependent aminotransferase [Pseudomonadota bacterium]
MDLPAFRPVPRTGVIYVMTQARKAGWRPEHPDWANLGQGAPETGELPGAPARITQIDLETPHHQYAPVDGLLELRQAVAELYNSRYRQGKASQYTADNVAICAGGRLGLTRLVSTLGFVNVGHFLPDYTAYEELLGSFHSFVPIPVALDPETQYGFGPEALEKEILGRGLSALLISNPCNPTGKMLHGEALARWVRTSRDLGCALMVDEFYSHYNYVGDGLTVSAAEFVDDVDRDPVVILDGLTKNWRYPGWRVSWTVGPRDVIEAVGSAGSFLDGGCAHPMQRAALPLLAREVADAEAHALQRAFRAKRSRMLEGLEALGIRVDLAPQGGFYCWGELSRLPEGLRTGMDLFRAGLDQGVIVVPGEFFDIDPGHRRPDRASRFARFARFSFGPSMVTVERGLKSLERTIR